MALEWDDEGGSEHAAAGPAHLWVLKVSDRERWGFEIEWDNSERMASDGKKETAKQEAEALLRAWWRELGVSLGEIDVEAPVCKAEVQELLDELGLGTEGEASK